MLKRILRKIRIIKILDDAYLNAYFSALQFRTGITNDISHLFDIV